MHMVNCNLHPERQAASEELDCSFSVSKLKNLEKRSGGVTTPWGVESLIFSVKLNTGKKM